MKKLLLATSICLATSITLSHAAKIEQHNLSAVTPTTDPEQGKQLWELHQTVTLLQNQIRQLNGRFEEQDHKIEQLEKELQNRYIDLDQRIEMLNQKIDPSEDEPAGDNATNEETAPSESPSDTTAPIARQISEATQPATAPTDKKPLSDKEAYEQAYQAYQKGGANQAIPAMEKFTKNYPNSQYISHAYYWLGEFYLSAQPRNVHQAKEHFDIVAGNYPKSSKAPAALYRLIEIAKTVDKDRPKAREYYLKLIQNYPNSKDAITAKQQFPDL